MKVKRLNKTGNYKSDLDYDNAFIGKDNPKGYFKMVIQPILNSDGQYEIRYMKTAEGYIVSGEAYIITNQYETKIDAAFRNKYNEKWNPIIQRQVESKEDLW